MKVEELEVHVSICNRISDFPTGTSAPWPARPRSAARLVGACADAFILWHLLNVAPLGDFAGCECKLIILMTI